MAASTFGLGRKHWSSPQWCYLHHLLTRFVMKMAAKPARVWCVFSGNSQGAVWEIQELVADTERQQETEIHQDGYRGQKEIRRSFSFCFFPDIENFANIGVWGGGWRAVAQKSGTIFMAALHSRCGHYIFALWFLLLMVALWNRAGHYIFALWFLFLSSSFFLFFLS